MNIIQIFIEFHTQVVSNLLNNYHLIHKSDLLITKMLKLRPEATKCIHKK